MEREKLSGAYFPGRGEEPKETHNNRLYPNTHCDI